MSSNIELYFTWREAKALKAETFKYRVAGAPTVPFVGSVVDTPHGYVEILNHRYDYSTNGGSVCVHITCRPV